MPNEEQVIFITIIGTSIALFLSITLFVFFISYQKRKFKYLREKQELQTNFHQELLRTQLEIQEQTLHNISQEIHDNIGQILSLVKINLNTANVRNPEMAEEKILRSKDLVSQAIADLRDLSKSLNTDVILRIGLCEALKRELSLVSKTTQCHAEITTTGHPVTLDRQKEVILFRIFQEILNNIITHAKAPSVNVSLDYHPLKLTLTVIDDGEGFDASKIDADDTKLGLGIRNMYNRAKLIGAGFKLTSIIGTGTTIVLELPLNDGGPMEQPSLEPAGIQSLRLANPQ